MRLQPFIVTSLVLGSLLAVDADAQAPEPLVFPAVADTYVHAAGHWKRRTFGTDTTLRADAKPERISYLRFAVSGVGTDRISRAVLRLQVSTASGSDSRSGGTIRRISNTTWRETSVTYATRPALDGPALATAGRVARGAAVDFDVTAAVGGDGLYSFALTTGSDDEVVYTSRETRTPPLLLLTLRGDPPTVLITAPSDGATFVAGAPITLHATATDVDDGDLGAALIWASDRQGVLGTGALLTVALAEGTHTLTAAVTDSDGVSATAKVTVLVVPPNSIPRVAIITPLGATTVTAPVSLTAATHDLEDGVITPAWSSDIDGPLGTGGALSVGLSVATHTLTAAVTDSDGATATAAITVTVVAAPPAIPEEVGFRALDFGDGVDQSDNRTTAQKPESKLWYNDGLWWATLFNPSGNAHHIHALDPETQTWVNAGVVVDPRPHSRQDVLWDGRKLYVVSRFADLPAQNRLLRYGYTAATATYTLDAGFPVDLPGGGTEAITLAKDSTGRLWLSYTLGSQVIVTHTLGGDTAWAPPFVLPVGAPASVGSDDIAAVVALRGAIGVFWSNQPAQAFYLAVHADGASPGVWRLETAAAGNHVADDHMNLKVDADGRLYAAVKTGHGSATATRIGLLVRSPTGSWSALHEVALGDVDPTRPQCLVDELSRLIYVFYSPGSSGIYFKASSLDAIDFPGGIGTPLIESPDASDINNPTTTKQNVDLYTGMVIVGSSPGTDSYWHNTIALP